MPSDPLDPNWTGTPPFVKPFLHALDRMRERETLRPEQLGERARALLEERFGARPGEVAVAFAHGPLGLIAHHTHYFDGFALLMPLAQGVAVAARPTDAPTSQLVLEGGGGVLRLGEEIPHEALGPVAGAAAGLVARLARRGCPGSRVEMTAVSTVPDVCRDAYLAALGVAAWRSVRALAPGSVPEADASEAAQRAAGVRDVRETVAEAVGYPFSLAYAVAAYDGRPGTLALVDAATLEQLPFEEPPREQLGWGLVHLGNGTGARPPYRPDVYREKKTQADEALALLRERGFGRLASFRDLEHRDLHRALAALPSEVRPIVRYLVTENRRVQKLIAAVRRRDWQMLGALLLIAHASRRGDEQALPPEVDFVVGQVEAMTTEGMYGACPTGHGSCVLVAGQPFVVPACLDRVRTSYLERFAAAPDVVLL